MAPEFGVNELPFTNENVNRRNYNILKESTTNIKLIKEMEAEDIEDGEILEDESNSSEQAFQNKEEPHEEVKEPRPEIKNNFEKFFYKGKRNHHESHKSSRRERFSDIHKKRKRLDSEDSTRNEKYYGKKNNCEGEEEEQTDEDMIFMLGGTLRDNDRNDRKIKHLKKPILPDPPDDIINPVIFNEGENEDPRPYSKRSPSARRDKLKKDRTVGRGVNVGLLKRRGGRGGTVLRKEKSRETSNDVCLFFVQGKCHRGSECPYSHSFNQPRKLEVCKFYLNDCCNKRDKCIYMHSDFPCKYFHTSGFTCYLGKSCKFSHAKLDEVQRAVLKKYSEMPLKELDDIHRYYRENSNNTYAARNKEKKDTNPKIPSLFDIKVSVPPEFRGTESIMDEDDEVIEGVGVTTPIPSPQSMMYENTDFEKKPYSNTNHHKHKILSEYNDHHKESDERNIMINHIENDVYINYQKKKSKKIDEHIEGEKNKKHSEKRKKRSKKEDRKMEKEKKKEKKHKRNKTKAENLEYNELDNFVVSKTDDSFHEDPFELSSEEKIASNADQQKEHTDALSHLPKKQQELFLRIQQHQKEADTSQNPNVEDKDDENDSKADENWYSSDEEEQEASTETTSPLATLLRTIQTSTSNVPSIENKTECLSRSINAFMPVTSTSILSQENDSISMVDPSQLANISISDEVTKLLTSIMKTDSSTNNESIIYDPSSDTNKENRNFLKKPFEDKTYKMNTALNNDVKLIEDENFRLSNTNLINNTLFNRVDNSPQDIDLRQLPFKPIPVHDAANEINASITSHPPMEYKLKPLPFIPKVNYATLHDATKICVNDPRFKRKVVAANTSAADHTQLLASVNPNDPRYLLALKSLNEPSRVDPRLTETRSRSDPRLDGKHIVSNLKCDVRLSADPRIDKEQVRPADFRDPRLTSRNKFPEVNPYPPINLQPQATLPLKETMPLRKEDPRLRFRANQNT